MANFNTIMVTGASVGFGRAITLRLAQEGYKVIAVARRQEKLQAVVSKYPKQIFPLVMDISQVDLLEDLMAQLPMKYKNIDVLINNAGLALGIDPIPDITLSEWDQMINTNIRGLIYLTQLCIKSMIKRNKGYIISIGSIAAHYPYKGGNVYGATKAFVAQFMKNLKVDLLGTAIKVTTIEPGLSEGTEFSIVRLKDEQKAKEVYQGVQALTSDDIANTISWLITLPPHVNINTIEMMPVCQAPAGLAISRSSFLKETHHG